MNRFFTHSPPSVAVRHRRPCIPVVATLLLLLCSCQKPPDGLVEVSGVVTFQSKPLDNGAITFVPVSDAGRGASGVIDEDGRFELSTSRSLKGIAPGEYRIRLESWAVPPTETGPPPEFAVPEKYFRIETSGLQKTIADQPDQQSVNLDLTE